MEELRDWVLGSDGRRFWLLGSLVGAEAATHLAPADGSPAAAGRTADPDGIMEEQAAPERTESPKQRKAKKGVNLRKSLAWDSAFFTSEGLLSFLFYPGQHPLNKSFFLELSRLVTGLCACHVFL